MAMIQRFEDLVAWQKARLLTRRVYAVSAQGGLARDWGLASQMQRAAVSVMSNVAEGFERGRPAEFLHFLAIAKASCAETRSLLYVAQDAGYLHDDVSDELMKLAEEVGRVIAGLRASIIRKRAAPAS